MPAVQLTDRVDITRYLDQTRATLADAQSVAAQHAILTVDGDRLHCRAKHTDRAWSLLWDTADTRRFDRVDTADTALTTAQGAMGSRSAGLAGIAKKLDLHARAVAALIELVDAKEDAQLMSPARAERLRTEARAQHADAARLLKSHAMRGIRAARTTR